MTGDTHSVSPFYVEPSMHWLGGIVASFRSQWIGLGNLETRLFQEEIQDISIDCPVYVSGLARSGSTVLLEFLASCKGVATHCYRDYPFIYTPLWWNWMLDHMPGTKAEYRERSHGDGIAITPESPEAMEEMLWMAFFKNAHDPSTTNLLGPSVSVPEFEQFYREHIKKLLWLRNGERYIAKGNYNIARLPYLHKLFSEACFVIPVRDPVTHLASLIRQHRRFCEGEREHPRALSYMQRVGHFEFGLDLRPLNVGDTEAVRDIQTLWQSGEEVRGWARYWHLVHSYLADMLEQNNEVEQQTLVLRLEDMCNDPAVQLLRLLEHTALEMPEENFQGFVNRIRYPSYYDAQFGEGELAIIREETADSAHRFGYGV